MKTIEDVGVPAEVISEINQIVTKLPPDVSCIATGSIIEGFGNANSDIDLYLVNPKRSLRRSTSIGLRKSRYVDCEHLAVGYLASVADRINGHTWTSLLTTSSQDFDRYYRLSIGIPVVLHDDVAELSRSFQRPKACLAYSRWALLRAFEHLARASCLLATGPSRQAALSMHEAALWYATSALAAEGEGYPSLKWVGEKAARRFRRGSDAHRELVDGWLRPSVDVAASMSELRAKLDLSPELIAALHERSYRLADRVRHVGGSETDYLIRSGESVAQTRGVASEISRRLAAGSSWAQATEDVAEKLSVPVLEVRVGAWILMSPLRSAGFLEAGAGEGV
ncbi:hypothetical protein KIF24_25475 [Micromonospora sp. Llam7]|uniref:hypothetical protein n=1 Tax=Micromonospora tarapacensis TaxID=2835305 RepID=UPI001C82842D|nr:hypothetical protein [Micromonospora tarapacensis]MBX7269046.1 hypothetical protein [Micromonospora tarapacensis]